jgi:type I restriction enzyme R subunit
MDTFDTDGMPGSRGYRRHLPHWRRSGAFYFVTFRLADSIPCHVIERWIDERKTWLGAHGVDDRLPTPERDKRYQAIPEELRRVFEREQARRLFLELDQCHGACLLGNPDAARLVAGALEYHNERNIYCGDYVIMPNHVHALLAPFPGKSLERILQSVKRYSAVRINALSGRTGTLWQKESYDHIVRNGQELARIRAYIENNPIKAKLKPGSYYYHRDTS